jgi:hypothetical protein
MKADYGVFDSLLQGKQLSSIQMSATSFPI